jgi:hypothetical protein
MSSTKTTKAMPLSRIAERRGGSTANECGD